MHMFDLIVTVNEQGQIAALEWRNHKQEILYGALWNSRIDTVPEGFPPLNELQDSGDFWWEDRHFFYERLRTRVGTYYFLKLQEHREQLYQAALDSFQDGVQIYDKNANVLYFNRASRVLSGFSDRSAVEGKYLMDLYRNIPEDFSTTLTALRTRKPVVARFASYNSIDGKPIIALNSGYPILSQDGHLLGAVVHEQNMTILQEKMKQLEKLKAAMTKQMTGDLHRQQTKYSFSDIIGHSVPLQRAVEIAERVSIRDGNVLLVGETGTGKEIFAQSIHYSSPRKQGKFVSINCAAVPET
ncbi:MAG: sigma 54-interacting transcriptional regulator, partial [Lawsonibacter sp.]|nr:sigma 54-interacting transcriptional regulator [Lawsonibacter sp.]